MAWKNLKQTSLADALVSTHSALEELDDVHNLIKVNRCPTIQLSGAFVTCLLEAESLYETLLEEINQQLTQLGLLIRDGEVSIIDTSVIEAKQNRPGKIKDSKTHKTLLSKQTINRGSKTT